MKGSITENLGDGLYRVEIDYDTDRLDAEIKALNDRRIANVQKLLNAQIAANAAVQVVNAAADAVEDLIRAYKATGDPFPTQADDIVQAMAVLAQANADRNAAQFTVSRLQAEQASIAIRINALKSYRRVATRQRDAGARDIYRCDFDDGRVVYTDRNIPGGNCVVINPEQDNSIEMWCADFSDELEVGTPVGCATVPGEQFLNMPIILPQSREDGELQGFDRRRDGQMVPLMSMSPSAAFYNLALLPGWQRWMPTYRTAKVERVDVDNDTVDIIINRNESSQKDEWGRRFPTEIGQAILYRDNVPVRYMSCNAAVFEEGDEVLVRFKSNTNLSALAASGAVGEQAWDVSNMEVVGFVKEPRDCQVCWIYFRFKITPSTGTPKLLTVTSSKEKFKAQGYPLDYWQFIDDGDRSGAGNIDWWGKNGVVLSWNGPPGRYFANEYMFPRESFSPIYFQGKSIATVMYLLGACFTDFEDSVDDEVIITRYCHVVHWVYEEEAIIVTRWLFNVSNEHGDGYLSEPTEIGRMDSSFWNWKWMCFFNQSGTEGRFIWGDNVQHLSIQRHSATFTEGEAVLVEDVNTRHRTWEAYVLRHPTKPTPTFEGWAPVTNAVIREDVLTMSARYGSKSLIAVDWIGDEEVRVEVGSNERWSGTSYQVTSETWYQHDDEPWNITLTPCARLRGFPGAGPAPIQEGVDQSYGYSWDMVFSGAINSTIGTTKAGSINTAYSKRDAPIPSPRYSWMESDGGPHVGHAESRVSGLTAFGLMYVDARTESFIAVAQYADALRARIEYPPGGDTISRSSSESPHRIIEYQINGVKKVIDNGDDLDWFPDDRSTGMGLNTSRSFGEYPDWADQPCNPYYSLTDTMPVNWAGPRPGSGGWGPRVAGSWQRFEYAFVYGPLITFRGKLGCTKDESKWTDVEFHALSMPMNKIIWQADHRNPNISVPPHIVFPDVEWLHDVKLTINGEEFPLDADELMALTGRSGEAGSTTFRPLGLIGPMLSQTPPPLEDEDD